VHKIVDVAQRIVCVTAANGGSATESGTNSYVVPTELGLFVVDPGPDDEAHLDELIEVTGGQVAGILVTHGHFDHYDLVPKLKERTGATVYAFAGSAELARMTDIGLKDGDKVGPFTAIHTPGHSIDHLCFALPDGVLFSGDLVMGWSSTVVLADGGGMAEYLRSLAILQERHDRVLLSGHGDPIEQPAAVIADLVARRLRRETQIANLLGTPKTTEEITEALYDVSDPLIRRLALETVGAHLEKLEAEGRAIRSGNGWAAGSARK
jgi:glyoxylase-like metal-dependent hydrolase (beta-lactamase superfamily II)